MWSVAGWIAVFAFVILVPKSAIEHLLVVLWVILYCFIVVQRRLMHMGWSVWFCLLFLVPLANLVMLLLLLVTPSKGAVAQVKPGGSA